MDLKTDPQYTLWVVPTGPYHMVNAMTSSLGICPPQKGTGKCRAQEPSQLGVGDLGLVTRETLK